MLIIFVLCLPILLAERQPPANQSPLLKLEDGLGHLLPVVAPGQLEGCLPSFIHMVEGSPTPPQQLQ